MTHLKVCCRSRPAGIGVAEDDLSRPRNPISAGAVGHDTEPSRPQVQRLRMELLGRNPPNLDRTIEFVGEFENELAGARL
jgi:hypothetical protein